MVDGLLWTVSLPQTPEVVSLIYPFWAFSTAKGKPMKAVSLVLGIYYGRKNLLLLKLDSKKLLNPFLRIRIRSYPRCALPFMPPMVFGLRGR